MKPADAACPTRAAAQWATTEQIATELERVARRWQQLPLSHAVSAYPSVRAVVQDLADEVAERQGRTPQDVPDLGPAVLIDQLRVMAFDYQQAGLAVTCLAERLTQLRRSLP